MHISFRLSPSFYNCCPVWMLPEPTWKHFSLLSIHTNLHDKISQLINIFGQGGYPLSNDEWLAQLVIQLILQGFNYHHRHGRGHDTMIAALLVDGNEVHCGHREEVLLIPVRRSFCHSQKLSWQTPKSGSLGLSLWYIEGVVRLDLAETIKF